MIDITIGITAHAESITLHKTLLSVIEATAHLSKASVSFEVILQLDNPTANTLSYANRIKDNTNLPLEIYNSSLGDPGLARNHIIKVANGKYITFIDGDDLMSENWLIDGYKTLISKEDTSAINSYVAHTELSVEFGEVDSVVIKQGEIDKTTDSLLSVYANRWNVAIMIERAFLVDNPYPSSPKGYGFEDWYINCLTIYNNLHNILIPKTALFIRRKLANSVWLDQKNSYHVLRKNPLLSFAYVRSLPYSKFINNTTALTQTNGVKSRAKTLLAHHDLTYRIARKTLSLIKRQSISSRNQVLPTWLKEEWQRQHTIDKNLFPNLKPDFYETITPEHHQAAIAYKSIVDKLSHDSYDYILFCPWIIKGGADLFTINYANSIAQANPLKNVLVITTTPSASPWKNKLRPEIDTVEFGILTDGMHLSVQTRVMEQLIENSRASHLHVINSDFAYNFIVSHSAYIISSGKSIVATSFSQSTDETGRIFGYSHTHMPLIYDLASIITTDNQAVADMWVREYGFDSQKIRIHNQPIPLPEEESPKKHAPTIMKILWAARISPEKQPQLVNEIAEHLKDTSVHIDMYGQIDDGFDASFLNRLPSNITYHGSYNGFESIHPQNYDLYLYTSLFDGMPNSVLEAGSYKIPVVASAVGGLPDLIDHNKNGLLVYDISNANEYAELIKQLSNNRERCIRLGEMLYKTIAKDFSEESYKQSISEMLTETKYL